ncbi:TetR/AcrR family transcriptional regulator [Paraburkholderia sp. J67]|uniref:TetR/AcrR family transcriptional regulator n=1 Tax=Paraburkholderia sp. J67 TaxID=2805435 RepID=UPI002ABD4242|nr:TetR/AcrR family transcriptional regulator [Paraburkholderia sp. J67]
MPTDDDQQRQYHHGDLRRAIIDTALLMLEQQRGWQFTLREIARRAEVSHSAPYRHFPDKASLLHELALLGFDRLRDVLDAEVDASNSVPAQLRSLAYAYLGFGERNPSLYRLMFNTDAGEPTDIHTDPRTQAPFLLVVSVLELGQRDGTIRSRPALGQATACWAHLHGLTMLSIDGRLVPEKVGDNAIEDALTTLLDGLVQTEAGVTRPSSEKP